MWNMTIGDLAKASGVHLETIRHYERIGLIRKPERTPGGYRSYKAADLELLRFIRCARELGFRLEKVRALLTLQNGARRRVNRCAGSLRSRSKRLTRRLRGFWR